MKHPLLLQSTLTVLAKAFCLALMIAPVMATAQNLVTNGGFTSNSSNWSTKCSIEINPEAVYGGSSLTNLTAEIDVERCFNQNVCILPGYTYTITYKASRRIDNATPANPGVNLKVVGMTTNTNYINSNQTYNNTSWGFQAQSYSFSIPAGSTDKKVDVQFSVYNNTNTYGVILDDITIAPAPGSEWAIVGQNAPTLNTPTNWSISNTGVAGTEYKWTFGSGSNPASSLVAAPSNIKWSTTGTKTITAIVSNGTCTVTTLSKTVAVTGLLAADFVNFSGNAGMNNNRLTWMVTTETNNAYYEIQRSANGTNFIAIGKVNVNNSNNGTYAFNDNSAPAGTVYYRIRQFDTNDSFKDSKIIAVNNSTAATAGIRLYPNPAATIIYLQLNSTVSAKSSLQVLSSAGNVLISKPQNLEAGANEIAINIASLPAGMYYLKLTGNNGNILSTQSFSKMN